MELQIFRAIALTVLLTFELVTSISGLVDDELESNDLHHLERLINPSEELFEEWEYEPRLWSVDRDENIDDDESGEGDGRFKETSSFVASEDQFDYSHDDYSNVDTKVIRKRHHFLKPDTIGYYQVPTIRNDEQKCTQFRVDTREAIICDKKRCDKLDFKWPQYDNQIAIIQTTKDGMRFHRVDFAFAQQIKLKKVIKSSNEKSGDSRAKLDIFELFKPTTPTSTTVTTTSTDGTTTTIQTTVTTPATEPTSNDTSTKSPGTTTGPGSSTTPTSEESSTTSEAPSNGTQIHCDGHGPNTTQLITTFRLDTGRRKQTMIGFGGALSDSTCRNIKSLSPDMVKSLMEDYYGNKGLRYNIARLTIGSSDFSITPYTNNDKVTKNVSLRQNLAEEKDDLEMNNFHLTDEDYNYKLPIARQAIATSQHELKFFSSLWSPPIWMKNNSHIVHGYLKGDVFGPYYKAMSELIVKWHEAYRKNGIEFWATTGLNEPVTGVKPFIFHNSVGITRPDYVTFYKLYFGPMMKHRGFNSVKLLMLDDNKGYAPNWVKAMLEDQEAAKYISGIAFHWYMNDEYENLDFISKHYPDKFIISSEACNGFLPFQVHALPGSWDRGVAYMYDIIKMIQKNAAAWVDWNMALDLTGGPSWAKNNLDAAIIVNARRDEYYKSPMFYAMGHFSRFVEPGSIRLDFRLANAKYDYPLEAVGFLTPKDYIVIVVLNANMYTVPFRIIVDRQLVRVVTLRADSFSTIVFKWKSKKDS